MHSLRHYLCDERLDTTGPDRLCRGRRKLTRPHIIYAMGTRAYMGNLADPDHPLGLCTSTGSPVEEETRRCLAGGVR